MNASSEKVPFYINDKNENYGVSRQELDNLGLSIPERVNAGLYGLDPTRIDLIEMDAICLKVVRNHGFNYVLEQLLTAWLLGRQSAIALSPVCAMGIYENQALGPAQLLHYANCVPAMYIAAWDMVRKGRTIE